MKQETILSVMAGTTFAAIVLTGIGVYFDQFLQAAGWAFVACLGSLLIHLMQRRGR